MNKTLYTVRKQGRQWGVYLGKELIEGGFFSRDVAEHCAQEWQRSI